jgi:hypothetical protein
VVVTSGSGTRRVHDPGTPQVRAVVVDVDVRVGRHAGSGRCVITGDRAVADLPGLGSPRAIASAVLPEWLAGLLDVGPRPEVSSPGVLILRRALLDDVLRLSEPDVDDVAAAIAPERLSRPWLELLTTVGTSLTARWRVALRSADARSTAEALEILDCSAAGLWVVQPCPAELVAAELGDGGDLVTLAPTTSTAVWAWLSRLAAIG